MVKIYSKRTVPPAPVEQLNTLEKYWERIFDPGPITISISDFAENQRIQQIEQNLPAGRR